MVVKNKRIFRVLYDISRQFAIICLLMEALFASAYKSYLYAGWSGRMQHFVKNGSVLLLVLFLAFAAIWGVSVVLLKEGRSAKWDFLGIGIMILVHYIIRVRMIGIMPMDDGTVYYNDLRYIAANPERFFEDFYNAGRMATHVSHGYIFLCMIGEYLMPGTAMGFQWVQLFMGIAASCCIYGIMGRMCKKAHPAVVWLAAFIVSVQPMFLGLSTMCNLEYAITVYFIFVFYCYINKSYILMVFWLLMLGTTKETGTAMALGFVVSIALAEFIAYIRKKGIKNIGVKVPVILGAVILALVAVVFSMLDVEVWQGHTLRDVISFGGSGNMTFAFNIHHFFMKLAQLYVLNFSWIWVIVLIVGVIVYIVNEKARKRNKLEFKPLFVLLMCYAGYTFFLLFYQEAKQPRYNMLSDVLLAFFAVFMLLKLIGRRKTRIVACSVFALIMWIEAFVTIDPLSRAVFTKVNTNEIPMVFTATFSWEKDKLDSNAGDFAFYNYQYTFIDRGINEAMKGYSWTGVSRILSPSADIESQYFNEDLRWDTWRDRRAYDNGQDEGRYWYIRRDNAIDMLYGDDWCDSAVLIQSPWCMGDLDTAYWELSKYYDIEGPYKSKQGLAGTVIYYYIRRK